MHANYNALKRMLFYLGKIYDLLSLLEMEENVAMKTVVFDIDGTMTDEVGFLRMHAPSFLKNSMG